MRIIAIVALFLFTGWILPGKAAERRPQTMPPDLLEGEREHKQKPIKHFLPPNIIRFSGNKLGNPPTEEEKWQMWQLSIEKAIYNRLKTQPESKALGQTELKCEIEYEVTSDGKITSLRIKRPSANFSFDGMVTHCLQSLQNERILNFPARANNIELVRLTSRIKFPFNNIGSTKRKFFDGNKSGTIGVEREGEIPTEHYKLDIHLKSRRGSFDYWQHYSPAPRSRYKT